MVEYGIVRFAGPSLAAIVFARYVTTGCTPPSEKTFSAARTTFVRQHQLVGRYLDTLDRRLQAIDSESVVLQRGPQRVFEGLLRVLAGRSIRVVRCDQNGVRFARLLEQVL